MLKNNLKGAQKLSKSELKSFTGGAGPGAQCAIFCFYDEINGYMCGTGYQCNPYNCGAHEPGYRCEPEILTLPHH